MNLYDALLSRRSIRRYTAQPIEHSVLERVLDAARWAPSAHNRQPWRFAVVQAAEAKAVLAQKMGARLRADRIADGDPVEVVEADVARSYARITGGAAVVAVCLSMSEMDTYPDDRRQSAERMMAVQGTAMAAQNLLLAAQAEGLGACWLCAPLFAPHIVKDALELPFDWEPQGLITMGYPDGPRKTKERKPLEAVTLWR